MNLEDIVREYVDLEPSNNGWYKCWCEVCGDGTHSKGKRGGWLFENNSCFYSCFNQNCEGNFSLDRKIPYSKNMRSVFKAFHIPLKEIDKLIIEKNGTAIVPKSNIIHSKNLEFPDYFYSLNDALSSDNLANKAKDYLKSRQVDYKSHPFFLSSGDTNSKNPKDISMAKSFKNRVIIPSYKNNNLVYYIGRSVDDTSKLRYLNADIPNTNIIYGYDRLYVNPNAPLFVSEGVFDAYFHLNGVAVLKNNISSQQIEILQKSPRKKVIIPDRFTDVDTLMEKGIELGWGVCIAKFDNCKDINEAINKYGKLHVIDKVMKNIIVDENPKIVRLFLKINRKISNF